MASNEPTQPPPVGIDSGLPYPPVAGDPSGALPYPSTGPPAPGGLPYPTTDTPGTLPYPPSDPTSSDALLSNPPPAPPSSTLPYPPTDPAFPPGPPPAAGPSPSHQASSPNQNGKDEKTYTDAPPPYSPPVGGSTAYPTPPGAPGQLPPPQPGFGKLCYRSKHKGLYFPFGFGGRSIY